MSLLLLPLLLASALALLTFLRRRGLDRGVTLAFVGLLTASAAALVLLAERPAGARLVVVLDHVAPSGPAIDRVNDVLERARAEGLAGYDVILVAHGERVEEPTLSGRSWRTASGWTDGPDDLRAAKPEAALVLAARRLRERPWLERLWDTLCLRRRRVVLVAARPGAWGDDRIAIGPTVERLLDADATLDLVRGGIDDPSPTLEILFDRPFVAADSQPEGRSLRLSLTSPRLRSRAGQKVEYSLDLVVDEGAKPDACFRHERPRTQARVRPRGEVVAEVKFEELLNAQKEGVSLEAGFHLLSATMKVDIGGTWQTARRERYLRAEKRQAVAVTGEGQAFFGGSIPSSRLEAAWEALPRADCYRPATVAFPSKLHRGERSFWSVSDLASKRPPFLLVAHDLSQMEWDANQGRLQNWVEAGMHLVVCGVPANTEANRKDLAWLPALARGPADKAYRIVRRPRVYFVTDRSRLSVLPYAPTGGKAVEASQAEPFAQTGRELQTKVVVDLARRLGIDAKADEKGISFPSPDAYVEARAVEVGDEADLSSRLSPRLDAVHKLRPDEQVGVNDVVVWFSYEGVRTRAAAKGEKGLADLLSRGATVIDVRLGTPFVAGANESIGPGDDAEKYADKETKRLDENEFADDKVPLKRAEATARYLKFPHLLNWRTKKQGPDVAGVEAFVEWARAQIAPRLDPREAVMAVGRLDRFVDEAVAPRPEAGKPLTAAQARDAFAAPLSHQLLHVQQGGVYGWAMRPGPAGSVAPWPMLVGARRGRGTVLVLAYSPFEGACLDPKPQSDQKPFLGVPFDGYSTWPSSSRVFSKIDYSVARPDRWGPVRIYDVARFHAELQDLPSEKLHLHAIDVVDARGRLRLECLGTPKSDANVQLFAVGKNKKKVELSLIDVDPARGRVSYDLPVSKAQELFEAKGGEHPAGEIVVNDEKVWLPRRAVGLQSDLDPLAEAAAAARHSGGEVVDDPERLPQRPTAVRVPAGLAFGVFLAGLWGWWAGLRVRRARATRAAIEEADKGLEDDAEGAVAQAGESLGRPTAALRAGAFAGYRPFEPGDRLESAHLEDLLLGLTCGAEIIPRVVQRIDDRATRLTLAVHVGRSMSVPAAGGRPAPKLAAACRVAELLAALVWARRGELTVAALGVAGVPPLGPLPASPGPNVLRDYLLAAARLGRPRRPALAIGSEEGGGLVYVSDFLDEDRDSLAEAVGAFEGEGGKAGAVHVFSPAEFLLLGWGVAGQAGTLERSGLDGDDLREAHSRFLERLFGQWEQTAGGLSVVSSAYDLEQTLAIVREGRLLDLLR